MKVLLALLRLLVALPVICVAAAAIAALFGFAVPAFDLLNHLQVLLFSGTLVGLLLVMLLFGRSRWKRPVALFAAAGLIASGITVGPEAAASFAARPPLPTDGRPVIKMMTHNLFGLNYDMPRVDRMIRAEDPDIIAFQEYFEEQASELHPLLIKRYPYFVRCRGGKRANLGLYSPLPFDKEMTAGDCPTDAYGHQRTGHILVGITLADGTRFSVMTTHMDWPYPIERQQEELKELEAGAKSVQGPLVLVGDFNSTPWSYALRNFVSATGLNRQTHNLVTYPVRFQPRVRLFDTLPILPLDHVMTRDVAVHELHAGAETGSDHLPVVFSFSVGG